MKIGRVVSTVVSGIGKVAGAFVPDHLRSAFAGYLGATMRPMLDRFGMQVVQGEDETVSLLRPRLISWLGDEGEDAEVRRYATKLSQAYMTDPRSVDPALASTALGLAAIEGDRKLFESYKKHFESAKTPVERGRYLSALGGFEDPEIRKDALGYALSGPIRPDEFLSNTMIATTIPPPRPNQVMGAGKEASVSC